jgi:oxygen-independent coproporphyrinogen-3 oxidase
VDAAAEALMMGLRLAAGVDETRFARETGSTLDEIVDASRLARLLDGGFIERTKTSLRVTPSGRKVLNAVLGALLA